MSDERRRGEQSATLKTKVEHLKEETAEQKIRIGTCEELCGEQSDRIYKLELWRGGNGARGAEDRLQGVEEKVDRHEKETIDTDADHRFGILEADMEVQRRFTDNLIRDTVTDVLDKREQTLMARLKIILPVAGMVITSAISAVALVLASKGGGP